MCLQWALTLCIVVLPLFLMIFLLWITLWSVLSAVWFTLMTIDNNCIVPYEHAFMQYESMGQYAIQHFYFSLWHSVLYNLNLGYFYAIMKHPSSIMKFHMQLCCPYYDTRGPVVTCGIVVLVLVSQLLGLHGCSWKVVLAAGCSYAFCLSWSDLHNTMSQGNIWITHKRLHYQR